MKKEGTIYTIVFIFITSFLFVFLLSLTNQITIERVELNQEIARQSAVLDAMGIDAVTEAEIQEAYSGVAADVDSGLYSAEVAGGTVYAKQFAGAGLWGTITGILAVTGDLEQIVGLTIVSDTETPGLGGRINEAWFQEQFRGEVILPSGIEVIVLEGDGDQARDNGIVDGVTGATRTSDSMEAIVNQELEELRSGEVLNLLRSLSTTGGDS